MIPISEKDLSDTINCRYKMRKPDVVFRNKKGGMTVFRNIEDIFNDIHGCYTGLRKDIHISLDSKILQYYLQLAMKTKPTQEADGIGFRRKRPIPSNDFVDALRIYINNFVLCNKCNDPETALFVKNKKLLCKECSACGYSGDNNIIQCQNDTINKVIKKCLTYNWKHKKMKKKKN